LCVLGNVGRTFNPCRECHLGSCDDRIFHARFHLAMMSDNVLYHPQSELQSARRFCLGGRKNCDVVCDITLVHEVHQTADRRVQTTSENRMKSEDILTPGQLAERLQVGVSWVYEKSRGR